MQGLTDGLSSRYISGNRSILLPALENLRIAENDKRVRSLHERLEELLVFEIRKNGGTDYHTFSVRTLHKHILDAITKSREKKHDDENEGILNDLALGRAIFTESPLPMDNITEDTNRLATPETSLAGKDEVAGDDATSGSSGTKARDVTYRELLGGFLHPRDLRKLVTPFSASNEPEFIVRRHVILLHFDSLRAIILRDRVLLLVPDGADSILVQLEKMILGGIDNMDDMSENPEAIQDLQKVDEDENDDDDALDTVLEDPNKSDEVVDENNSDSSESDSEIKIERIERGKFKSIHQDEWAELEGNAWVELPFELQSVDAILNRVASILAEDVMDLQLSADKLITDLLTPGADVGERAQEVLRTMKNLVKEMQSRVTGFHRALENMLEDYEEMSLMNLSRLLSHPERFIQPVSQATLDEESDEPELILEAHLQRAYTLTNALNLVQGQVNTTEEFVVQKSDSIRNRLLYINMLISLLSLAVAGASFVGSVFGMNVPNPLEDDESAFTFLTAVTIGGSLGFVIIVFFIIRLVGVLPSVM
ncbi:unnamed protein product [Cylindrotheca closterium]|uniref:Magnesium transporter n=1 Tax=Cylindrotheca closterium TaxID=2856 RepID=A0AAD2CCG4_9STRA|nr:unnamed protein product [Cylindrotheca closterium]